MPPSQVPLHAARTGHCLGQQAGQVPGANRYSAGCICRERKTLLDHQFPAVSSKPPISLFAVLLHPSELDCCEGVLRISGRARPIFSHLSDPSLCAHFFFSAPTRSSKPFYHGSSFLLTTPPEASFRVADPVTTSKVLFFASLSNSSSRLGPEALALRFYSLNPQDEPLQAAWRSLQRRQSLPAHASCFEPADPLPS